MSHSIYNAPSYSVFYTNAKSIDFSKECEINAHEYRLKSLDGYALSDSMFLSQEDYLNSDYDLTSLDIADSLGEWLVVAEHASDDPQSYLAFSDSFGYSPVFYKLIDGECLIVSSSFHGIIAGLDSLQIAADIDLDNYILTLSSDHPTFQNIHSDHTMASGVRLAPQGKAIYIDANRIEFFDRGLVSKARHDSTYEDLLSQGVNYISDALKTHSRFSPEQSRRITLTGGVDSRLCFGLLTSSGQLPSYNVSTIDPRTWKSPAGLSTIEKDLAISNRIRNDYDLKWWSRPGRQVIELSFMESLTAFQSYRSNLAFTFRPATTHSLFDSPVTTVRGGGGEILRVDATLEKLAEAYQESAAGGRHNTGVDGQADWFASRTLMSSFLVGDERQKAAEALKENFRILEGSTFLERLYNNYFSFRYRGHFGHQRQTISTNDTILHLLSNAFFLKAAQSADFDFRINGRIVKDIFNLTDSNLLSYPFENDKWSKRLNENLIREVDFSRSVWIRELESVSTKPASVLLPRTRARSAARPTSDLAQVMTSYLRRALGLLEELVPNSMKSQISRFNQEVLVRVQQGRLDAGITVAKVASVMDVFFPQQGIRFANHYLSRAAGKVEYESSLLKRTVPSLPVDGYHDIPLPSYELVVRVIDRNVHATVVSGEKVVPNAEYAFYLYLDGKRTETSWYDPSNYRSFTLPSHEGNYYIEFFVRDIQGKLIHIGKSKHFISN
ncbi:hypothetical protein [Glutamicibacter endophyticus]|uniref:hypothetical protein n=1 Tax=Glutamicibacter endophyticus TaxID=1522174 RepID=UPI003AF14B8F